MGQTGTATITADGGAVPDLRRGLARHRRAESTGGVRRLVLPLACLLLAAAAYSYGLTAPVTEAALGPLRVAWLPFVAAGALLVLAPLTYLLTGVARPSGSSPSADPDLEQLVAALTRRTEEVEELLAEATATAERAGADAEEACRQGALIVVRAVAEAAQEDDPEEAEAVRAFSERLLTAFCYLTPMPENGTGVPAGPAVTTHGGSRTPAAAAGRSRRRR